MRDLDAVTADLHVLAGIRRVMRAAGWRPSLDVADQLLDEHLHVAVSRQAALLPTTCDLDP